MASSAQQRSSSAVISDDCCAIASRLNASAEAAMGNTEHAAQWAAARLRPRPRVDNDDERPASASPKKKYDVFINHRGVDTKHNVARLLYDRLGHLSGGRVRSFLDNKSMRPGDRLHESINEGIRQCRVAVAIFSPRYFDSDFCLHELANIVESRKVLIPIFYGIKPSELILPKEVVDSETYTSEEIERFKVALKEARYTVGLTYDPTKEYVQCPPFHLQLHLQFSMHAPLTSIIHALFTASS